MSYDLWGDTYIIQGGLGRESVTENLVMTLFLRRCGGLIFSALASGWRSPGLSPGWEHCFVFLDKTLYFHSASHHSGV